MARRSSGSRWLRRATALPCALALAAVARGAPPAPDDLVVTDFQADAIIHVDRTTGDQTEITSGGLVFTPRGVAAARNGFLYVSDSTSGAILRVDPSVDPASCVGAGLPPNCEQALVATIQSPRGIAVDAAGLLYVMVPGTFADPTDFVVRFDPVSGRSRTIEFGDEFRFPTGIAIGASGQLLVSDSGVSRSGVIRMDPLFGGQEILGAGGLFSEVYSAGEETSGDVLLADASEQAVFRIDTTLPYDDMNETANQTALATSGLSFPSGLVVDRDPGGDEIFVVDFGADAVVRVDPLTGVVSPFTQGDLLQAPWRIDLVPPQDPFVPAKLLAADPGAGMVYRVDPVADTQAPFHADMDPLTDPRAIALDLDGNLLVVDGPTTIVRVDAGDGSAALVSSGGSFVDLTGIAVEADGSILVSDAGYSDARGSGAVHRVDPGNGDQSLVTSGATVDPDPPEEGETPNHQLVLPTSIALDPFGAILVTDTGDETAEILPAVVRVDPLTGAQRVLIRSSALIDPRGLTLDFTDNDLVLVDAGQGVAFRVDRLTGQQRPIPLDGVFPAPMLESPVGVAIDSNRDLVIADDGAVPDLMRVDALTGIESPVLTSPSFMGLSAVVLDAIPTPVAYVDTDADGIPDPDDNCTGMTNPEQLDGDFDGFGNACDPDYNQDGAVSLLDFATFRAAFGSTLGDAAYNPLTDHNEDGGIGIADFAIFRSYFGNPPGPSGLPCAGATVCLPD